MHNYKLYDIYVHIYKYDAISAIMFYLYVYVYVHVYICTYAHADE